METRVTTISSTTLTAAYGPASGLIEVSRNITGVTLYIAYKAGTAGDKIQIATRFSPDNTLYFSRCSDNATTTEIGNYITDYEFTDTAGASATLVIDEYLGKLDKVMTSDGGTSSSTANSVRLKCQLIPKTGTTPVIRHNGTAFGTVTEQANVAAFTAPASLAAGTVEWALSTGELNFSAADLVSYVDQEIKIDYSTPYNLFRIPLEVNDPYMKISIRDSAAGSHGVAFVYTSLGSNYK